jgi:hypothetical protein
VLTPGQRRRIQQMRA